MPPMISRKRVEDWLINTKYACFEDPVSFEKGIFVRGQDPARSFTPLGTSWLHVFVRLLEDDPRVKARETLRQIQGERKGYRKAQKSNRRHTIKRGTIRLIVETLDRLQDRDGGPRFDIEGMVDRIAKELEK